MSKAENVFDRIDISDIFSQHLTTFYHYEKKQFYNKSEIPFSDKVLFLFIPVLISISLYLLGLLFDKDYVAIVLTCLSIFAGLLFGLLTMVFNLIQQNERVVISNFDAAIEKITKAKIELTKQLFINIAFSIVLSIFSIVFVLATQLRPINLVSLIHNWQYYCYIKCIYLCLTNCIAFFLLIEFLLTILMIVRRFTVLFVNTISLR
jgi:hypothetical protein